MKRRIGMTVAAVLAGVAHPAAGYVKPGAGTRVLPPPLVAPAVQAVPAEPGPPPDFTRLLAECGLPDLATATYVRLSARWNPRVEDPLPYDWESSGNAWMLSETRGADGVPERGVFFINGGETVELAWRASDRYEPPRNDFDPLAPPPDEPPVYLARWQPADPLRDARKAVFWLDSLADKAYPEITLKSDLRGRLALHALALWRQGRATAARELWRALAERSREFANLAEDVLNLVADGQYENLYRRFRADRDWAAYRDGLRELLARYPPGWRRAAALRELRERVEAHMSAPPAAPDLAETEADWAARMCDLPAVRCQAYRWQESKVLWAVPGAWLPHAPRPLDLELEIRAHGVAAIPFLLKLADDGALTAIDRASIDPNTDFGFREKTDFEHLNRPATRGEVAEKWLADLLPDPEGRRRYGGNSDDLRAEAREFFEQHGQDGEDKLAVLFLPAPYGALNSLALEYLLERAKRGPVPALEDFLRAAETDGKLERSWEKPRRQQARLELAQAYAARRGVRPEGVAGLDDFPVDMTVAKGFEILRTQGSRALTGAAWVAWSRKLENLSPSAALRLVLNELAQIPDAEVRLRLTAVLQPLADKPAAKSGSPVETAEAWETLIADDRPAKEGAEGRVADAFLILNERLYAPPGAPGMPCPDDWRSPERGAARRAERLIEQYGARGREWLRARVRRRLAGVREDELPRYPDELPPDEAAVARGRDRFAASEDRAAAVAALAAMDLADYLALAELLRREPEFNARLAGLANRIDRVEVAGDLGEWGATFKDWEGRAAGPELLRQLQACVEDFARAGRPVSAKLARQADFAGCELWVDAAGSTGNAVAGFAGLVCAPGVYGACVWRTAPPLEKYDWRAVRFSGAYAADLFRQAAGKIFDSSVPAPAAAWAVFQTQGEQP